MFDPFLILTPVLLLAIVALLGFVGCYQEVTLTPGGLTHVQTVVKTAAAGTQSVTADPLTLQGEELIVVAVQWSSAISGPDTPALSSPALPAGAFQAVNGGGPFSWNNMLVQIFSAINPAGNTQLALTASLLRASTVTWNVCVSAYAGVNESAPLSSPIPGKLNYVGNNPQTPPLNVGDGGLVYAVAFGADSDGTFPGSNPLTAGPGFTAEFPQITNPLVENGSGNNPVTAQATNANPDPNAKGFIFAMVLNAAS